MNLSAVRLKKVPFKASIEGLDEALTGEFNPRAYTPNRSAEFQALDLEDARNWAVMLAGGKTQLLVSWNLTYSQEDAAAGICKPGDVGKPVPITVESLQENVPIEVLAAVFSAIGEAARPNSPSTAVPSEISSFSEEEEGPVLARTD